MMRSSSYDTRTSAAARGVDRYPAGAKTISSPVDLARFPRVKSAIKHDVVSLRTMRIIVGFEKLTYNDVAVFYRIFLIPV